MRTLRLTMVAAATWALLGIAGGPSVAQDEADDTEFAAITGTFDAARAVVPPEVETAPEVPQEVGTGWIFDSILMTNDRRLSGSLGNVHDYYGFLPGEMGGAVRSGTGRLTNDRGSWLVECQGFTQPDTSVFDNTYWVFHYTGDDGFEGLSAMTVMLPSWSISTASPGPTRGSSFQ